MRVAEPALAVERDGVRERQHEWLLADDLLLDIQTLVPLACEQATAGAWFDTALLLGAISQVLDDHLHRSRAWAKRLAEYLGGNELASARALRSTAQSLSSARAGIAAISRRHQALIVRRDDIVALAVSAAEAAGADGATAGLAARVRAALECRWPDDLAREVMTVPSCFRGFDQHPADLVALAEEFAARHPNRDRPVTVFGVRTSGSYLGPLLAAALRGQGYEVEAVGIRQTDRLDRGQRAALRRVGPEGLALVVDDPPVSGYALADTVDLLVAGGLQPSQVIVTIASDDPDGVLPRALADRPAIILPGARWYLASRFTVDAVKAVLDDLIAPLTVANLVPTAWPGVPPPQVAATARRHHRQCAYEAELEDERGTTHRRTLLVESVGQGWFGRHAVAVARRLEEWVPDSIALVDGCHFQWLPEDVRTDQRLGEAAGGQVADYLVARHCALPAPADRTLGMEGRQSVWEVAAEALSQNLGPAAAVVRPRVVGPATRQILAVPAPSIVDGRMDLSGFLASTDGRRVVKLSASEGAFSHRDLPSYDPVFDLAAVADEPFGPAARRHWEQRTGRPVEPERWLLQRLVHTWDRRRHGASAAAAIEAVSRAFHDYLGEVALHDLAAPAALAPVAALDVDGVLETYLQGTSAPGADGIVALRALVAHGHQVVLATGRSAGDVRARLSAWRLSAGVAEYGAVLVDGPTGALTDLRSDADRRAVAAARAALSTVDGVTVDPGHEFVVRAYRHDRTGARTGLTAEDIRLVRGALDDPNALVVVPGESQSDLVPAGCNKQAGLRTLLGHRPAGDTPALALAVGDGPADLGMLAMAAKAYVPRHAASMATGDVTVTRHAYQAGLADAVADVIGHRPGGCPECALDLSPANRFILATMSLRAAGPAAMGPRLAKVVGAAAAVTRSPST